MRSNRLIAVTVLVVATLAATARGAEPEWTIGLLPAESDWLLAIPNGVNDRGEVCGVYVDAGGWYYAQKGLIWRDGGYAVGALLAGVLADLLGITSAITAIAALTFVSGVVDQGYERSLAIFRELGRRHDTASCLTNVGNVHRQRGAATEAERRYLEAR